MVDRIDKTDPNLLRVQEAPRDRDRRQRGGKEGGEGEEGQEKEGEKDEFEKEKTDWKKLIPKPPLTTSSTLGKIGKKWAFPSVSPSQGDAPSEGGEVSEEKERSLSLSERLLVLWGILDFRGRPRIPVIVTYAVVAMVAILSLGMIVGLLWR